MNATTAAYLNRLGLTAEAPSAEALRRLHRAHVERVPYETFWLHLGEARGIAQDESVRRIATTTTGGYCYTLNGAFASLLADLGYRVGKAVAGVHDADGPQESTLRNHVALLVDGLPADGNPGGRWYADTGLGDLLHEPLPLVTGVYVQGPARFGLNEGGLGDWHFTHAGGGVTIVDAPVGMDVFAERHAYHRTDPRSSFAKTPTAQRRHATGSSVLRGCVLTRTGQDTVTCERLGEWLDVLEGEFGMRLDAPRTDVAALWTRVLRAHEAWAATA